MMLTDGTSTETKLVLKDRFGFVKLAIAHGMQLVPGFCFGEKWVHETVLLPRPIRRLLYRHFRLAGVLLKGRWWTFLGHIHKPDGTPIQLGFVSEQASKLVSKSVATDGTPSLLGFVRSVHRALLPPCPTMRLPQPYVDLT